MFFLIKYSLCLKFVHFNLGWSNSSSQGTKEHGFCLLNFHDTCSFKYFVQSYFNYFKYFYHWKETNSVGVIWCIFITFYTNWFKWKMIWYLIAKKADHPALNIHTHTCVIMLFVQTIIFRMTRAECFKMTQISCQRDSLNIFIL